MMPIMMAALFIVAVITLVFSIYDDSKTVGMPLISMLLSIGVIFSGQNMQVVVYDAIITTRDVITTYMGLGLFVFSFVLLLYNIFSTPFDTIK